MLAIWLLTPLLAIDDKHQDQQVQPEHREDHTTEPGAAGLGDLVVGIVTVFVVSRQSSTSAAVGLALVKNTMTVSSASTAGTEIEALVERPFGLRRRGHQHAAGHLSGREGHAERGETASLQLPRRVRRSR